QIIGWLPTLLAGYEHPTFWLGRPGVRFVWGGVALALAAGAWRLLRARAAADLFAIGLVLAWAVAAYVAPYVFARLTYPPGSVAPVRFAAFAVPALLLALAGSLAALGTWTRIVALAVWCTVAGL